MSMTQEESKASVENYVLPGRYNVKFVASNKEVQKDRDIGVRFKVMCHVTDTNAHWSEDFTWPRDEKEKDQLQQMVAKATQKIYVEYGFAKLRSLHGVAGKGPLNSIDDVLALFDEAYVNYQLSLSVTAVSKTKRGPNEHWPTIQAWFEEHIPKARWSSWEGVDKVETTFFSVNDENKPLIAELTNMPGVYISNKLGTKPPRKV